MNHTELIDLLSSVAASYGYTVCSSLSLPSAASHEPFPLFCIRSLRSSAASDAPLSMATYRLEFSLLALSFGADADELPEFALLERDGRDMLHTLAHNESVVAACLVSLEPSATPLTHALDRSLNITADITVFLP